jgi:hypothetical protein
MEKKSLGKKFKCPICRKVGPWGDIVKHAAYSSDPEHMAWRTNHGFPASIPFGKVKKHEPAFRAAVVADFPQSPS